jgi:hypothetical protein
MPKPSTRSSASIVKVGRKACRPFLLQVMVFSPESGYKFEVVVERQCSPENEAIWKLVFDLYKKETGQGDFVQIVHVSFTAGAPTEQKAIAQMATDGVSPAQSRTLAAKVFPATKKLAGVTAPSEALKKEVREAMRSAVVAVDV